MVHGMGVMYVMCSVHETAVAMAIIKLQEDSSE